MLKRAVATFRAQDIGNIRIMIINNGSTDGTRPWLSSQHDLFSVHYPGRGLSVAASWNRGLQQLFQKNDHVLVVNDDVELRPDTYRWLVADGGEFVTAVGTRDPKKIEPQEWIKTPQVIMATLRDPTPRIQIEPVYLSPDPTKKRRHPDFSAYLIRRSVWEKVGPFDEKFLVAYAEDADMHLRMYRAGIDAYALELPFLHHGAQTLKNAEPEEQRLIQEQAERNREYFKAKYGFSVGSIDYYAAFNQTPLVDSEAKEVASL